MLVFLVRLWGLEVHAFRRVLALSAITGAR